VIDLGTAIFRANPHYTLTAWNRLGKASGPIAGVEAAHEGSFGVLLPADGTALPSKALSAHAALVFLSLREPGPLPPPLIALSQPRRQVEVARLLLDRVIEVNTEQGFVDGLRACVALGLGAPDSGADGVLARISYAALDYALALPRAAAPTIARKLYLYHRAPPGPRAPRVAGARETLDFLLADGKGRAQLERAWSSHAPNAGWLVFAPVGRRASAGRACKLYVSPRADALPSVFRTIAIHLAECGATQFKVGLGTFGLLRPDKVVAYFAARDELLACGERLARDLKGVPAHGVPFTAALSGDGLLSWGVDPQRPDLAGASWRQWITGILAEAVAALDSESSAEDGTKAALARLASEGIDPATFAPTARWMNEYAP
jgi:hypothetical protein